MAHPQLTLHRLQQVLKQDAQEREAHHAQAAHRVQQHRALRQALTAVWQDCRKNRRPRQPNLDLLYSCPISPPRQTLVPLRSLPLAIQTKLLGTTVQEDGSGAMMIPDIIVQVPLEYLNASSAVEDTGDGDKTEDLPQYPGRRPLDGNLTSKLSEYTRGMSGRAKPFRPGGEVEKPSRAEATAATSPEQIERSRQVLALTKESHKAGDDSQRRAELERLWLTAPPGVDFAVGLSYEHVYGTSSLGGGTNKDQQLVRDQDEGADMMASEPPRREEGEAYGSVMGRQQPKVTDGMFARSFFDDDSLFGSSSSGSRDDEDSDDDDASTVDEQPQKEVRIVLKKQEDPGETGDASTEKGDEEGLEQLLQELTLSSDQNQLLAKKKTAPSATNPLRLAQRQALHQHDATRKSWATTKLLPISQVGLHTYIPNPAMTFPFELDDFQQQAIARLERSESVFVAAHTSAGKTVVAEYAVALAKQRATRCVYTSPIKALSNQKFRDFGQKFGAEHVGLVTGDLQVNVDNSTVLIMTTEILRSMLYRGADLIRDIEFVVFDEVHYVNDSERGVVWEEVIIMLPSYVNLIFLSATTPNTLEFGDWIGRTKRKPVHVVKTDYRPVPLSHHLWAGTKLFKVLEGKGQFLEKGYSDAANALLPASMRDGGKNKGTTRDGGKNKGTQKNKPATRQQTGSKQMAWQAQGNKQNWMSLVRFLDKELLTPAVVFSFSKKKCEDIAQMLQSLDLNTAKERSAVQGFTIQAVARLSENDSKLPQVLSICEMATRGIGVHHGGLLPILKEMVEILFSRNLIKVLLATETFAMGVNMPAKAVVFSSLRKHDGSQFRSLEPGEYTQMAGRAGRRGLDKVGTVILCCFGETPMPQQMLRTILTGKSTTLRSQFRLTYNMILNLLRVEEMSVESMIKRSFSEFATQRALTANEYPKLLARGVRTLGKIDEQLSADANNRIGAEDIEEYFVVCKEILQANKDVLSYIRDNEGHAYGDLMIPGRILLISAARLYGVVRAPAIILRSRQSTATPSGEATGSLVCLVLMPHSYAKDETSVQRPAGTIGHVGLSRERFYSIQEIDLEQVLVVTNRKHKIDTSVLLKEDASSRASSSDPFSASKPLGQKVNDDPFAGMKPIGKKVDDDPFAGMQPIGKKVDDDPFAGMKPLGKKGKDGDFFGKGSRLDADPFAGMKPLGQKGRGDDDFFGKAKPLGQKGKGDIGFGVAKEEKMIDETVKFLLQTEQAEVRDNDLPLIDLRTFLKRGSDAVHYRKACDHLQELTAIMRSFASHRHPNLERWYCEVERREELRQKVGTLQHLLSNESLQLFPDFLQRKSVLRRLGYVDHNETVCVKGRVACEVNTCEELIATEMVFEGILNDMEPEEIAAVLSALVYQEKKDEPLDAELPERLVICCEQMKKIATNLGQLQKEQGLNIDPGEYCEQSLKFGLVHVVYEWALGVPFKNICELTDVQEGSIVRCITRLDELCREVRNCARVVGNPTLYRKVEAASVAIKRDIVFASSLYVS